MPHSYSKLWVHIVWRTKESAPLLTDQLRPAILMHIVDYAKARGYAVDTINGVADHLHCLVRLEPKHAVSDVVNAIKGEAAHWINAHRLTPTHFAWQQGFAAFSVSEPGIERVREYIRRQVEHHRRVTFAEEVASLFKEHNIRWEGPEGPR